jgi:hypothetical protein
MRALILFILFSFILIKCIAQELAITEIRDTYNPRLLPGINVFKANILTGVDKNYSYRNIATRKDAVFGKASFSTFFSSKDTMAFISAMQFDAKVLSNYNVSSPTNLDVAPNALPMWVTTASSSFYLNTGASAESGRYKFSWNRYTFTDKAVNEYCVEVDVLWPLVGFGQGKYGTGGFIFTRMPMLNRNFYGFGYRYDIIRSRIGNNLRLGLGYTRQRESGNDKAGKFKTELILKLVLYENFSLNLYAAYSRNYLAKLNVFEIGTFFNLPVFTKVILPRFND